MSVEGEVDLNDLIKKDKEQARKTRKTQFIKKERKPPAQRKHHEHHEKHIHQRVQNREPQKKWAQRKPEKKEEFRNLGYALQVSGFISDVSIEDICNLAKERKLLSVKTQLKKKDRTPINPKTDIQMEVVVTFLEKEDADSFIREYSEKILDGEHPLTFTFVSPTD